MSMTILKIHHTFDVFWINSWAVKGRRYTKIIW
ncbi:Uncharacterised protein [Citrobacter koseri]|nr:Uncharacterised protein [Citrobacter koseri]